MVVNGSQNLQEVQRQFQVWRQQRTKGQRIPDALWKAAAALYPHHSIYQISRTLRLDHMDLKARVGVGERRRSKRKQEPQFIELPFTSSAVDTAECLVKARDRRGYRIHIKVKGTGLGAVLEALKGLLAAKT
jgi:hypothetical protein